MQDDFSSRLIVSFSNERLEAYRQRIGSNSNLELFCYYAWNMALSESLYPSLQILEISLRNTIHNAASKEFQCLEWYNDPAIINSRDIRALDKAKKMLLSKRKNLDSGRVVSELSFGFWTSLLDSRYEQILWPVLLKSCFPMLPKAIRTRKVVSKRFQAIRRLRNRVFHHEPIWHWKDLTTQHADIIEAIGWIEPTAKDLTIVIDNFEDVHKNGLSRIEEKLKSKFCY